MIKDVESSSDVEYSDKIDDILNEPWTKNYFRERDTGPFTRDWDSYPNQISDGWR